MPETIGPDFKSAAYLEMASDWEIVGDCYKGTRRMRECGQKYLPQFDQEKKYERRLNQAIFYNLFRRTHAALVGLVFRNEPQLENVPPEIEALLENADNTGEHWVVWAKEFFGWAVKDGHAVAYCDMPEPLPEGATLLDEMNAGRRPYWIRYAAADVMNWRTANLGGQTVLTQITLREMTCKADGDFGEKEVTRYRVLNLNNLEYEEKDRGRYVTWRLFEEAKDETGKANGWVVVASGENPLPVIPIAVCYGQKEGYLMSTPPLKDLADLNIAHYQTRSDYRNIMHVANVPILFLASDQQTTEPQAIGGSVMIERKEGSTLTYVEHHGYALGQTRQELMDLEAQMDRLGVSIATDTKVQQTATQSEIDATRESSELQTMARSLQDCLELMLGYTAMYLGIDPEMAGSVNFEKVDAGLKLDPALINAYSGLVTKGQLTLETLLNLLKNTGEMPEEFAVEDELAKLQREAMPRPVVTVTNPAAPVPPELMPGDEMMNGGMEA